MLVRFDLDHLAFFLFLFLFLWVDMREILGGVGLFDRGNLHHIRMKLHHRSLQAVAQSIIECANEQIRAVVYQKG